MKKKRQRELNLNQIRVLMSLPSPGVRSEKAKYRREIVRELKTQSQDSGLLLLNIFQILQKQQIIPFVPLSDDEVGKCLRVLGAKGLGLAKCNAKKWRQTKSGAEYLLRIAEPSY